MQLVDSGRYSPKKDFFIFFLLALTDLCFVFVSGSWKSETGDFSNAFVISHEEVLCKRSLGLYSVFMATCVAKQMAG